MHFCCVLPVRSWEGEHCPVNPSDVPCFQKEAAFWSLISRCPTGPCTSNQFYFFSLSLSLPCLDFTFCPSAAACGGRTEAGGAPCRSRDSLGASPGIAGAFITPDYFFPALFLIQLSHGTTQRELNIPSAPNVGSHHVLMACSEAR